MKHDIFIFMRGVAAAAFAHVLSAATGKPLGDGREEA